MEYTARKFKIWDFSPSHERLLLRSPKDSAHGSNVDVVFFGVEYLELPTKLAGFSLVEPSESDYERIAQRSKIVPPRNRVFALESGGRRHLIVAVGYNISENQLEIFASSLSRI